MPRRLQPCNWHATPCMWDSGGPTLRRMCSHDLTLGIGWLMLFVEAVAFAKC